MQLFLRSYFLYSQQGLCMYSKGPSINDVTPIFQFFDPPPSPCHPSYALKITPNCQFLYPPPSPSGVTSFIDGPLGKWSRYSDSTFRLIENDIGLVSNYRPNKNHVSRQGPLEPGHITLLHFFKI